MSFLPQSSAYFLVAHGSRDPRSRQALEVCAMLVREQLATHQNLERPWPFVGTGILEFGDPPLAAQIAIFAQNVARDGVRQIFLLPLFLMSGNHVNQDLPEAVQQATQQLALKRLGVDIQLILCPHLGSHVQMPRLIRDCMAPIHCDHWVLLAHGTRRPQGNQSVESLATQLGATPAYWATEPTLEAQLQTLAALPQRVGIVPYFLFTGSIIDAIYKDISRLRLRFTKLDLQLTQPLNPSALLAQLLLDRCGSTNPALQR
jgi:sirohydrochlorin cobaltochelatase